MKRLVKKAAESSEIKAWDGSQKMLARLNRYTKGIFTEDGTLYVWKDYNLHHASAQESLGIRDCAHILIDRNGNTINVEYPRGAHAMYDEYMSNSENKPQEWFSHYQQNSNDLFDKDVADIQSKFPDWNVTRRQFPQQVASNKLKKLIQKGRI